MLVRAWFFFFFNDTATTEIYTLSLHDALPISLTDWFYVMYLVSSSRCGVAAKQVERELGCNYKTAWRMLNKVRNELIDRKSTRLNSSHANISYAVFCLKKKKLPLYGNYPSPPS